MGLAIIGLSYLGTSLGLALKSAIPDLEITGHDPDPLLTSQAKKRGAIDKSHWNLSAACVQADIVLMDQPFSQLEVTFQVLAETLAEDALIIDFSLAKRVAAALAVRLLPKSIRFAEAYLVPNRGAQQNQEPTSTAFSQATFYLATTPETNERAIQTASGLASAIGAHPCFVAPDELDSLIAAGNQAPLVTAMALMTTWQQTAGWQDRKNALGAPADWVRQVLENLQEKPEAAVWQNRDLVRDWLSRIIASLQDWQVLLDQNEPGPLEKAVGSLDQVMREQAETSQPEGTVETDDKTGIRQLFLGSIGRRMKGKR
ncbi:MAG: prephenate dehydrogenase/arogenate dehydrogenase family protein [Anaerolineae bacterium]